MFYQCCMCKTLKRFKKDIKKNDPKQKEKILCCNRVMRKLNEKQYENMLEREAFIKKERSK